MTRRRLDRMREMYNLTQAEAKVAVCIGRGDTIEQCAEDNSHRLSTSRNLLKRVFAKTGVNRRSELISLIVRSTLSIDADLLRRHTGKQAGVRHSYH